MEGPEWLLNASLVFTRALPVVPSPELRHQNRPETWPLGSRIDPGLEAASPALWEPPDPTLIPSHFGA